MHLNRLFRAAIVTLLLLLSSGIVGAQANAEIRFVHVIPDATSVDVYINGSIAVRNLEYGSATNYIDAPAGQHVVSVTPTGISAPLWEQDIVLASDDVTTFIASSSNDLAFVPYTDDLQSLPFGTSRLLVVHAIAGGPNVDVQLAQPVVINGESIQNAGTPLGSDLSYGTALGTFDIPSATYEVAVLPTGESLLNAILPDVPLTLAGGTSNIALVYGKPDQPAAMLLSAPTQSAADSGFVRFAHLTRGAPDVDVYINDTLMVPGLSPLMPSPHIALPSGSHTVALQAAGTAEGILTTSLTVSAGVAQTVAVLPDPDAGVAASVFVDDISSTTETNVTVSLINAVPDSTTTVTLPDGTQLGSELAFAEASPAARFSPDITALDVQLTLGDSAGSIPTGDLQFNGGVYYNLFLLAGTDVFTPPQIIVAPTSLSQTLASVPNPGVTIATGSQPASGAASASGADDSEVVFETDDTEVVQQPAQPAAPTPAPATAAPAAPSGPPVVETAAPRVPDDVVTGRVNVNPDANLQLRLRPSPNEQSLGLAPSGTVLVVNGREGRPVELVEGQGAPAAAQTYVDPATQLVDERDDLDPESTWLNITYNTPDGGEIRAWVNALYVDVFGPDGEEQRLADLPTVGRNVPGSANSTEVTPPPPPEDRINAEVIGLDPGVALNVRRAPSASSERLTGLPGGTIIEVEGLNRAEDWAFVTFRPADSGTVTGWVSTQYLDYRFNGETIILEDLRNVRSRATNNILLQIVSSDVTGEVSAGASVQAPPTPDPTEDAFVAEVRLDPGANLQFRRNADRNSESLALIPSGTRLIVEGRDQQGEWLQATFEGQEGWIASQFVVLSFNGEFVDVFEVPVINTN